MQFLTESEKCRTWVMNWWWLITDDGYDQLITLYLHFYYKLETLVAMSDLNEFGRSDPAVHSEGAPRDRPWLHRVRAVRQVRRLEGLHFRAAQAINSAGEERLMWPFRDTNNPFSYLSWSIIWAFVMGTATSRSSEAIGVSSEAQACWRTALVSFLEGKCDCKCILDKNNSRLAIF